MRVPPKHGYNGVSSRRDWWVVAFILLVWPALMLGVMWFASWASHL